MFFVGLTLTCILERTRIAPSIQAHFYDRQGDFALSGTAKLGAGRHGSGLSAHDERLDRDVVAVDQIRTILQTFRDRLFTEMFPGRRETDQTTWRMQAVTIKEVKCGNIL